MPQCPKETAENVKDNPKLFWKFRKLFYSLEKRLGSRKVFWSRTIFLKAHFFSQFLTYQIMDFSKIYIYKL